VKLEEEIDNVIGKLEKIKKIQVNTVLDVYVPVNFKIQELVDPKTYRDRGNKAIELLEPKLLWTIDQMRELLGPITINDWLWNKDEATNYKYSGFRPKHTTVGTTYSQHRLGRAMDLKFKNHSASTVRNIIRANPNHPAFQYITCIENKTPTWVHIDCRPISDKIKWIDP